MATDCSVVDDERICGRVIYARGLCSKHHRRWLRHGDTADHRLDSETRFWTKVDRGTDDECWLWLGTKGLNGYGIFAHEGRRTGAHRYAYELLIGPISDGLTIDHLCRVRACVNPKHLEPVTHLENVRRGGNAAKTHCKHGHLFDEANTGLSKKGRYCRECHRLTEARRRERL